MDPVALDADRPMWGSAKALVLAVCGAGVGYAAFFRLPYMILKHGAGTFYVAQLICLLFFAWPMSLIELVIGQHFRKGSIEAFTQIHRFLRGVPMASLIAADFIVALYSSAVMSWATQPYIGTAFEINPVFLQRNSTIPILKEYFEEYAGYNSTHNNYGVFMGLALLWVCVAIFLFRGVRSMTYLVYLVVPLPLIFFMSLSIYAMSLDGALDSISSHMKPISEDFATWSLWADAMGQSLLLTQASTGVLVAFGSYTRPVHNCYRLASSILFQGLVVSTFVTLCVASAFSTLHITEGQHMGSSGSGLWAAFVVYPPIISEADNSNALIVAFFTCTLVLGVQSIAATIHACYTMARDKVPFLQPTSMIIVGCFLCMLCSAPMCFSEGYEFVVAVDTAVVSCTMPFLAAMEMIGIGYMWSDRGIFETVRERGVGGCCLQLKTFVVVAYNHSVGKIREVMASQGRSFFGNSALPLFVKFVVPVAGLMAGIGNYIVTFFYNEYFSLGPTIVGVAFPVFMLLVIAFFIVRAPPKKVVAPWNNLEELQENSGTYMAGRGEGLDGGIGISRVAEDTVAINSTSSNGFVSRESSPPSLGKYVADQRVPNDSLPREASEDALRDAVAPQEI